MPEFTEEQLAAIRHKDGPMLVLAGPGSGKTTVITQRVKYLTKECGVAPGNILVITFTKAAATEMENRYRALVPQVSGRADFGTFHAVFFKILKLAYHYSAKNILREEERAGLLQELVRTKIQQDFSEEKELVAAIGSEISMVKNGRFPLETYYSANCPDDVFRDIFRTYEQALSKQGKLDFDDMLVHCYRLLSEREDILRQWQAKYKYILIDEFQDINRIQYDIIGLLSKPENNLFVVGDDDQSIYSFRGAKPELMQAFLKDFGRAAKVTLSCNFRSTEEIVSSALRLISNNHARFLKELYAKTSGGERVEVRQYPERRQECAKIAEEVAALHRTGIAWKEIAVLYRTNLQTRTMMSRFMEYNIPFQTREGVPCLYDHWICRDVLCYLRMAHGDLDRSIFLQVMNRPKRYLSRESLETPVVDFRLLKGFYQDKAYMLERIGNLEEDLVMLRTLNPFAAVNYIRRVIGYDGFLTEYAAYRKMRAEELFETLSDLQEDAAEYQTFAQWLLHMEEYRKMLELQRQTEQQKDTDAVTLTTYHSAKGLEFHTVFLPEVNEELAPYRHAVLPEDIEEERRMFYVAMTRAKRRLVLSSIKELRMKELSVSRFIKEVMRIDLSEGTRVWHKTYGKGTVRYCEQGRIGIRFDNTGEERVLNAAFCLENGLLKIESQKTLGREDTVTPAWP